MEIKDLQANQGKVDLVVEVVNKEEPRTFEKFGKSGRVCSAKVKDDSGEVKITLWNEDVEKVSVGDKIHVENGWCSEYQGEKQVSAGKFGKIEVVSSASNEESSEDSDNSGDKTVYTNDPNLLSGQEQQSDEQPLENNEDISVQEEELEE